MLLKDTSLKKSGNLNLLKAVIHIVRRNSFVGVVVLLAIFLLLLSIGETPHAGPSLNIGNAEGFESNYQNGTYSFFIYSFNSNGTPNTGQHFKIVLENHITFQPIKTMNGSIDSEGISLVKYTSSIEYFAQFEILGPKGYQGINGYTITPSNSSINATLQCFPIYETGFNSKAGFGVISYNFEKGLTQSSHDFRLNYSYSEVSSGSSNSSSAGERYGHLLLGNYSNFRYIQVDPNYNLINVTDATIYGNLQVLYGKNWSGIPGSILQIPVFTKISPQYLNYPLYNAFLGPNLIFPVMFAIVLETVIFGIPKSTRYLELILSKPLSRNDILFSRFGAIYLGVSLSTFLGVMSFDFFAGYYTGVSLTLHSIVVASSVTILTAIIFSTLAFLPAVRSHNTALIISTPFAIFFFFYYVYDLLITGLSSFLATVGLYIPNRTMVAFELFNPLFIVDRIRSDLTKNSLPSGVAVTYTYYNFPVSTLLIFLAIWAIVPALISVILWKGSD